MFETVLLNPETDPNKILNYGLRSNYFKWTGMQDQK